MQVDFSESLFGERLVGTAVPPGRACTRRTPTSSRRWAHGRRCRPRGGSLRHYFGHFAPAEPLHYPTSGPSQRTNPATLVKIGNPETAFFSGKTSNTVGQTSDISASWAVLLIKKLTLIKN